MSVSESTDQSRPQASVRITGMGRKRYIDYLAVLEWVLEDAATAVDGEPHRKQSLADSSDAKHGA